MTRTKNPGARNPEHPANDKNADEPWISNYPPLREWLTEIGARCDFQIPNGKGKHRWMVEQWRAPGSMPFIVVVMPHRMGWEIYTPFAGNAIDATLADAKARIFPTPLAMAGATPSKEG